MSIILAVLGIFAVIFIVLGMALLAVHRFQQNPTTDPTASSALEETYNNWDHWGKA